MAIDLEQFKGHTEGPWEYESDGIIGWFDISSKNVPNIAECVDSEANARLIAAAPTLLREIAELEKENDRWMETVRVNHERADKAERELAQAREERDKLKAFMEAHCCGRSCDYECCHINSGLTLLAEFVASEGNRARPTEEKNAK